MKKGRILAEREQALEEAFFRAENERLLERMRERRDREQHREALKGVCGVADLMLLDALLDQGINAETLSALRLAPLVCVAWADGRLARTERASILEAASACGLDDDCPACDLLRDWLDHPPAPRLLELWQAVARDVWERLEPAAAKAFADEVQERAHAVATAAGWALQLPPRISREQQQVLDEVARAFADEGAAP